MKLSDAQIASYENVTQQVFLNVVTAAMDVMRDRAIIDLNEKNRELIAEQLKAAQHEFDVGSTTRTDVAQAKARLADAEASLTSAKASYQSSLARYTQYAGMDASDTSFTHDTENLHIPTDLLAAQQAGSTDNPAIVFAKHQETAADEAVTVAEGDMYPGISLVGNANRDWHNIQAVDDSQDASLGLRATMNLYEGGATQSRIRQAKFTRFERSDRVEEAQRAVSQEVATAWNNHQAALANIEARQSQVEAAGIAREGVGKEREVGTRTLLDSLDADQELLNAQVGLVSAKRDAVVADYALLAATGQLTPSHLGLMSPDAENDVRKAARGHFVGFSSGVKPRN